MKVVALDFGAARTGVAVSDATGTLARPVGVVEKAATPAGLDRLVAVVGEHDAELVLVGLPLTLRGERGEQARATESFVEALRARLAIPVETYDERFTTTLAQQTGGSGAGGRRRRSASAAGLAGAPAVTRWLALAVTVVVVAVGAFAVTAWVAGGDEDDPPPPTTAAPKPLARLRIIFPEGFTVAEMADRVAAVRQIAITKRGVTPRLTRAGYLRAVEAARAPARFRKDMKRDSMEGFLFPALYEFTQRTTARELVADQLRAFRERFRTWTSPTRARRT